MAKHELQAKLEDKKLEVQRLSNYISISDAKLSMLTKVE